MKLAKKDDVPYLVIEITAETKEGKKVKVEHDVNVVIRRVSEVDEMNQPLCPPFEVHVELPHADALRPVVEHLARMSDIIWFSATRDGRFRLGMESDSGDVETLWTGLKNVDMSESDKFRQGVVSHTCVVTQNPLSLSVETRRKSRTR
jgi:HUS1 checkpoint protein